MKAIWITFLQNHVFANLAFILVLVMGGLSYSQLPRAKDPEINFNWIQIFTVFPGATAEDIERQVTNPLEEALLNIKDVKFMSSASRGNVSSILVRFEDVPARIFDKRLNNLRREIQNAAETELPSVVEEPLIIEITSANAFPTAMLMLSGASDELLRRQAYLIAKDLGGLKGVQEIKTMGFNPPQLHVELLLEKLQQYGLNPTQVSESIRALFQDLAAGQLGVGSQQWLVRLVGTETTAEKLADYSLLSSQGYIRLAQIAEVSRGYKKPEQMVKFKQQPAVMFLINKKSQANTLKLVQRVNEYMADKNSGLSHLGMELELLDDQTVSTKQAINVMQTNALIGLILVLFITWLFLGLRMALLTSIGIPFILAGTFWFISMLGFTLNNSVLLAVVISLGMLVDDAVVVVEAIYYRVVRGMDTVQASIEALQEVFWPVTTAVATTMSSFLPLILLPGILGKFLLVVPVVVITALAISLVEAYWMLPAHVIAAKVNFAKASKGQRLRQRYTLRLQHAYVRSLLRMFHHPFLALGVITGLLIFVIFAFQAKWIKVDFFAMDGFPLFYVTVEMPSDSSMQDTLAVTAEVEKIVLSHIKPIELRNSAVYAGQIFTEMENLYGDQWGQVVVSLNPDRTQRRRVDDIIDSMRADISKVSAPVNISFLPLKDGPPVGRPISVKVRGDDFTVLQEATAALEQILSNMPAVSDISNTDSKGRMQLSLRLNQVKLRELSLNPQRLGQLLRILSDGDIVSEVRDRGEKLEVRVRAKQQNYQTVEQILDLSLFLDNGMQVSLRELVTVDIQRARSEIRHYNSRRNITVEADLDTDKVDIVTANHHVMAEWAKVKHRFVNVNLDFSGTLDDIQESMDSMAALFLMGLGMMYMILGAQFKSYFQPLLILLTVVPLAFIGVAFGLMISQNPLSLFTMYGIVALTGIAVNAAIVLMSAAHDRLRRGMSITHATVYAARRRVVPILITTLTTMASLFSLATGLAGESLMWGPVATAIVWGLGFSATLTLYLIPLLFRLFVKAK